MSSKLPIIIVAAVLLLSAAGLIMHGAEAASVTPEYHDGNDNDLSVNYPSYIWDKLDDPGVGTYEINGVTVTIEKDSEDDYTYIASWSSSNPVYAISLKGGSGYYLYLYPSAAYTDSNLICPSNSSGKPADISHISVGVGETPESPAPTETPESPAPTDTPESPTPGPTLTPDPDPTHKPTWRPRNTPTPEYTPFPVVLELPKTGGLIEWEWLALAGGMLTSGGGALYLVRRRKMKK